MPPNDCKLAKAPKTVAQTPAVTKNKVCEKFGLRTLRAAEQFEKPSAESDDPATLPAIKHANHAAVADSTWMAKESITHTPLRKNQSK